MPLLARRGSISTRAYGQLAKTVAATISSYNAGLVFDNNNDISLFTASKFVRLAGPPFSTITSATRYSTTQDLQTWTAYSSYVGGWGTGKYHVADSSYRPWVNSAWDTTANAWVTRVSPDGLQTWNTVTSTNITQMYDLGGSQRNSGVLAYGDTWWRNFGRQYNGSSADGANSAGQLGPRYATSTDGGVTYTLAHAYEGQAAPYPSPSVTNTATGGLYGNVDPYVSWSSTTNQWAYTPVGIFNGFDAATYKTWLCGSGGTLLSTAGGSTGYTTFTKNTALLDLIGPYTWLIGVGADSTSTKICVVGFGQLKGTYTIGSNTRSAFAAVSNDGGATWTLANSTFASLFPISSATTHNPSALVGTSYFRNLFWDGSRWVMLHGLSNNGLISSTDGITWTVNSTFATALSGAGLSSARCIVYNGSKYVAGCNSGRIVTSTDFSTWTVTNVTQATSQAINVGLWNGTKFIMLCGSYCSITSPDAVTWTQGTITGATGFNTLIGVNGLGTNSSPYFTYDRNNGTVFMLTQTQILLTSTDGLAWSAVSDYTSVMANAGISLHVIGVYSNAGQTSSDMLVFGDWGETWVAQRSIPGAWGNFFPNQFARGPAQMEAPYAVPIMTNALRDTLTITAGGSGFSSQYTVNVRFSAPNDQQYGWEPIVSTITISGGAITAISLADIGAGYTTPPTVTITDSLSGIGATATCSFRTSASNPAVTMRRIMYWNYPASSFQGGFYGLGRGWYGYSAVAALPLNPSTSSTGYGVESLIAGVTVKPGVGDVNDAAGFNFAAYSGMSQSSYYSNIVAQNDLPTVIYSTYTFSVGSVGTGNADSAYKRMYFTDLSNAGSPYYGGSSWAWSPPTYGAPDSYPNISTIYFAGKFKRIYNLVTVWEGGPFSSLSDPVYYMLGMSFQTKALSDSTSASTRVTVQSPIVMVARLLSGGFQILNYNNIPADSRWDIQATGVNSFPQFLSMNIASNGVSASKRATQTIVYSTGWSIQGAVSQIPRTVALRTTDGGATWTSADDLLNYLSSQSLSLYALYWNDNESLWVIYGSNAAAGYQASLPLVTITTPDFVTYTQYPDVTNIGPV